MTDTEERARRLTQYLMGYVDDDLRAVSVYERDDHHFVYLRDDLRDGFESADVDAVIDELRSVHRSLLNVPTHGADTGLPTASVHTFEESLVMQFLIDPTIGIVASFEPSVGRDLLSFIGDCLDKISDGP